MITYSSNNSGGSWWLSDEDWINLENAGWKVRWGGFNSDYSDRKFNSYKEAEENRFLGALASEAEFNGTEEEAIASFEDITGQDADEEGCNCCGRPHSFY